MDSKDLINYSALSKMLTGNDNSIRKNKVPKKFKKQVQELENLIDYYITKNQKL